MDMFTSYGHIKKPKQHCTLQAFEQSGALYICTTTMTNIRLDRNSNLVPPGYKTQSIRTSHRGCDGGPTLNH